MLLYLTRMWWNRLSYLLTGRKPRLGRSGCAWIQARELEGGYYYLTSPDLPGFRATLSPEQLEDLATTTQALEPALNAYLQAYSHAQHVQDNLKAKIVRGSIPYDGRRMNLVAGFRPI